MILELIGKGRQATALVNRRVSSTCTKRWPGCNERDNNTFGLTRHPGSTVHLLSVVTRPGPRYRTSLEHLNPYACTMQTLSARQHCCSPPRDDLRLLITAFRDHTSDEGSQTSVVCCCDFVDKWTPSVVRVTAGLRLLTAESVELSCHQRSESFSASCCRRLPPASRNSCR